MIRKRVRFDPEVVVYNLLISSDNKLQKIRQYKGNLRHSINIANTSQDRQRVNQASGVKTFVKAVNLTNYISHKMALSVTDHSFRKHIVVDTGAGVHLTKIQPNISNHEVPTSPKFTTANGRIKSNKVFQEMIEHIGQLEFRALDNTPEVVSVGKLVHENDMMFVWVDKDNPILIDSDGKVIVLKIINFVPHFQKRKYCFCQPDHTITNESA